MDGGVGVDAQAGVVGTKDVVDGLWVFRRSGRWDKVSHSELSVGSLSPM